MRLRRWLLMILLVFVLFGGFGLTAHPASAHPLGITCYSDGNGTWPGCDGYKPPPFSACQNTQYVDASVNLTDYYVNQIGVLNLWESNSNTGCASFWGDALDTSSTWQVTAIGMWESGGDGSNRGGLDRMPHTLTPGKREDTFMVGMITCIFCGEGCYHVAIDYIDDYGYKQVADTPTVCTNY